jgi:4-amino-4-deoxy-L-arabinose transferase-like glycosyltransferase
VIAAGLSAGLVLGSDVLWKFSVSGQSTLLLLLIFLGLFWCLLRLEEFGRKLMPDIRKMFLLALAAGLLMGLGMLTRYSFGWLVVPVIFFVALFGGERRAGLAVTVFLAFMLVVTPWILRNLAVSGTLFGTAGYAVAEGIFAFPNTRLMQSLHPDLTSAYWIMSYGHKFMDNLGYIIQSNLFKIGGVWTGVLFFAGVLAGLAKAGSRRLRYFVLMGIGVFIFVEALGRTSLTAISPETSTENLLVLFTPFVTIFAVGFFMIMLDRLEQPSLEARFGAAVLLAILVWQPLISTIAMKTPPVSYPPYYPPDVQKISHWMHPDELTMSDIPWAVAWYGDRPCVWTTVNSQYEFFQFNDYVKPVRALYLSLNTLNGRLFTDCMQGGVDSWGNFVLKTIAANQLPQGFPLKNFPLEALLSGLYLTDRQRWQ